MQVIRMELWKEYEVTTPCVLIIPTFRQKLSTGWCLQHIVGELYLFRDRINRNKTCDIWLENSYDYISFHVRY